jgi:glycosyltransferase involved in cell wall biosynthesis
MTRDELAALYRMCDCFVSLHRSEGFGFGPAEAMSHRKPVIVTDYSGVCDFCIPETALLVSYDLIPVKQGQYPFLDADRVYEWAEPDLDVAAQHMQIIADNRERGEELGHAAQTLVRRRYCVQAIQNRYLNRLEQLGFGKRPAADVLTC